MATTSADIAEFPPFPDPPDGVKIVPFCAFVPAGYQRVIGPSGDTIEVDAWAGVQTIKVLNEEEVAQKRKENRKRRNAGITKDPAGNLIPWWEEWEEGEARRIMSDSSSFETNMSLEDRIYLAADDFRIGRPWPEIAQGVRLMWDQFRLYIGLISSMPVYKKIKNKKKGQVDGPDNVKEGSEEEEEDVPRAKLTKVDIVQDYLEERALPGKQLEPNIEGSTVESHRLRAFLADMEKTVKVFLSSHMLDTGLIWTEKNLFIAPNVLHFFLRFMLRNNVFGDSAEYVDNLKRALSVAELAQEELPITAKLGQMLPGRFDLACKECWGTQGSLSIQISATFSPSGIEDTAPASDTNSAFEAELKENDVEVIPSNVALDSITARQVMEDNLDTDHQVPVTTIPQVVDPWTAAIQAEEYTTSSWTDVSVPWLMQVLGPSVFPLTMTTGIVECSTRRIKEVIAPGVDPNWSEKASGVEEVLGETLFKVVMSPWVVSASEETADFPIPVIIPGSENEDLCESHRDDVTILVDEEVAGQLRVGMGLSGTWVQLVCEGRKSFWYIESLVACYPSYYTEGEIKTLGDEEDEED